MFQCISIVISNAVKFTQVDKKFMPWHENKSHTQYYLKKTLYFSYHIKINQNLFVTETQLVIQC